MSTAVIDVAPRADRVAWTSVRELATIEARRYAMRASLWVGWAGTVAMAVLARSDWPGGSYETALPLSFSAMILGTFIAGVRTGRLDTDTDLPPLAEESAIDGDDRRAARLWGLVTPFGLALATTVVLAVVTRIEGGFWLGEGTRRTDTAVHTPLELLQPALVVTLAGALGVVAGATFRRPLVAIVVGGFAWFILFPAYWIWNTPPLHTIVPVQIMPLRVPLRDLDKMADAPADWYVEYRTQYSAYFVRDLVHTPTIAFHTVYLVGLLMVVAAAAARMHRRTVRIAGILIVATGVVAQLVVSPFGWTG